MKMGQIDIDSRDGAAPRRALRSLTALLAGAALVACMVVASATAAPQSRASAQAGSTFCTSAKGVEPSLASGASFSLSSLGKATSLTALEANFKTALLKVKTEEPIIIAAAPSAIKGDLAQVFVVENKFVAAFQKVNFNFMALAPYEKTFLAEAATIKKPLAAIEAYYKANC